MMFTLYVMLITEFSVLSSACMIRSLSLGLESGKPNDSLYLVHMMGNFAWVKQSTLLFQLK